MAGSIFLALFTTIILSATAAISQDSSDSLLNCTSRWIHIRNLPPRFNLHLLSNCSQYHPMSDDFCPYLPNHGLGHKTHSSSLSWYRTDPSMLELIFHRRMLEYPCLTSDPRSADAIFLPYYSSIDALRYLYGKDVNNSHLHGIDLHRFLLNDAPNRDVWERNHGHDHFLVMARPAWDFSQDRYVDPPSWGTSFLELPEFYNVTALTFESRAWPWQEQAVPYPTSFHPPNLLLLESWIKRVRRSRRSSLMLFAGGGGASATPNIRRSIRMECDDIISMSGNASRSNSVTTGEYDKLCDVVDCSNGICDHDPIRYMRPMLQSTFCLQPPGDTPTRRSTFDSLLAGCIPVFFEDLSAKAQYTWHLPEDSYEEFSVSISKEDVVFKGLKILDVLKEIPRDKVRRMRGKVVEIIPRILYRKHGSSLGLRSKQDAFDIAIEGVLQRIKSRLEEFSGTYKELSVSTL